MRVALIQMSVTADKEKNIAAACQYIRQAAEHGADMAVLPEMFCCPYDNGCFRAYGEEAGGPAQTALSKTAAELGIYVVGGSLPELEGGRVYNTSYVYGRRGELLALPGGVFLEGGQRFMESDTLSPGDQITTFDTEFGPMGLCICFDLRFEELARCMCLRGCQAIVVPAAFNMTTGPAHWELLFRQRAVDNQCFTLGCAPARDESGSYVAWGHSMVCEPWGGIVHQCGTGEEVAVTELELSRIDVIRRQLPILSARRTDLYEVQ